MAGLYLRTENNTTHIGITNTPKTNCLLDLNLQPPMQHHHLPIFPPTHFSPHSAKAKTYPFARKGNSQQARASVNKGLRD